MDERLPPEDTPSRHKRIEHHEVIERGPTSTEARGGPPVREGTPMWLWILPLVVLVLVLAWFIFTRGEPRALQMPDVGGSAPAAPAAEAVQAPAVEIQIVDSPDPAPVPADPADAPASP